MIYGFQYDNEKPQSMSDYIYDVMTSSSINGIDSNEILDRLSKFDYDSEECVRLRKFIDWRSDTNDDPEKFFDDDFKTGRKALIQFAKDLSDVIAEKSGIKYVMSLTNQPEFDTPDDIVEMYEKGTPIFTDSDLVTLYGYPEMPHAQEPSNELLEEAFSHVELCHKVSLNETSPLSDQDVLNILHSHSPVETLNEICDTNFKDLNDMFTDEVIDSLRKDLPMWSRDDIQEYIYQNTDGLQMDYSCLLDEEYCCYIELDGVVPIYWDNGLYLDRESVLASVSEQLGYSVDDVDNALSGKVSNRISSFPASLAAEYSVTGENSDMSVVFLVKKPLKELIYDDFRDFKIAKGTRCGFFDSANGSGGEFKIMIDKDITIPRDKAKLHIDCLPENSQLYSIRDTYDLLGDDLWDPIYSFQKERNQALGR